MCSVMTVTNPGDRVVIFSPFYENYGADTVLCGAEPTYVELHAPAFTFDEAELEAACAQPGTKALILCNPSNPCGHVFSRAELEFIAKMAEKYDLWVITDEVYEHIVYAPYEHVYFVSLPGMEQRTLSCSSLSKTYSMTGWRLGYACGPKPIIKVMTKIHQSCIMCAPTTSQYAAVTALKNCDADIESMRKEYDLRRRWLVNALNNLGLTCFEPQGAFYVFPSIQKSGLPSDEFCKQLLYSKKVAVIPGPAFGDSGEGFVRISYSYSLDHLKKAVSRMEEFLKELGV